MSAGAPRPAAASKANITRFAIQCNLELPDEDAHGSPAAAGGETAEPIMAGSAEWRTLGELEYAIRLAIAECREETSHMRLAVGPLLSRRTLPVTDA